MKLNKRIILVMSVVCSLFFVIIVYLTVFTLFEAKNIVNSSYNQRIWEKEEKILRGKILDRSGTILAQSKETDNGQTREYPFKSLYAHSIGYNSKTYGKTNLELKFNDYLLKTESVIDVLKKENKEETNFSKGANLLLTLDNEMTKLVQKQMADKDGSAVVLNPVTGEVYCLYSNPSFDPNEQNLIKNWDNLSQNSNAPFVSRATQGVYAPGSTFKIVTAAAGIESGHESFEIVDKGKETIGGKEFKNSGSKAYGKLDMSRAFAHSSNIYFASLSQKIGNENLKDVTEKFYVTKKIPFDITTKAIGLDFNKMDDVELASTSIGQGKLLTTPLNMAMVASAIANNGIMMKPYLVSKAYFEDGKTVYEASSKVLSEAVSPETSEKIKEYMIQCVKSGTGRNARVSGVTVAAKTGTAENEKQGKTHAWFVCFAPAENPQIAMCIMKEYSGSGGGTVCAPIAANIIKYAVKNGLIKN